MHVKYAASELLVVLIVLAVLCSLGTCVLILFILIQECGRWSIRKFKEVAQIAALSLRVESGLPSDRDKPR